jgi:hypothetical protein
MVLPSAHSTLYLQMSTSVVQCIYSYLSCALCTGRIFMRFRTSKNGDHFSGFSWNCPVLHLHVRFTGLYEVRPESRNSRSWRAPLLERMDDCLLQRCTLRYCCTKSKAHRPFTTTIADPLSRHSLMVSAVVVPCCRWSKARGVNRVGFTSLWRSYSQLHYLRWPLLSYQRSSQHRWMRAIVPKNGQKLKDWSKSLK